MLLKNHWANVCDEYLLPIFECSLFSYVFLHVDWESYLITRGIISKSREVKTSDNDGKEEALFRDSPFDP